MLYGSVEAVVVGVQEDAKAEIEKIERDLATTIARLREEDSRLPVVVADADVRVSAARRQGRDRIAAEDRADHQAALTERESWIEQVVAEGERRLRALDPGEVRADLVRLAREAFERMPDQPLEVLVSPAHVDLADAILHDESIAASGRTIAGVKATPEVSSGCIVQTVNGRIRYDNTYRARGRRFEAAWRARLGGLYGCSAGLPPSREASADGRSLGGGGQACRGKADLKVCTTDGRSA
jgi:vacuolar-type H+-ATPase subunit E/Vma4